MTSPKDYTEALLGTTQAFALTELDIRERFELEMLRIYRRLLHSIITQGFFSRWSVIGEGLRQPSIY